MIIMKKIAILFLSFVFSLSFSQGKLYIQNFSAYDLTMRIVGGSPTNCFPEALGSVITFPAHTQTSFLDYNSMASYAPNWTVRLSYTGNAIPQTAPSGLLTTISPITQWKFCWFHTMDPGTHNLTSDIDFNMGDPAFPSCPWASGVSFVDGTLTDAFWFYVASENATYLVIQ